MQGNSPSGDGVVEVGDTNGTHIACRNENQSLWLTYTPRMVGLLGVEER